MFAQDQEWFLGNIPTIDCIPPLLQIEPSQGLPLKSIKVACYYHAGPLGINIKVQLLWAQSIQTSLTLALCIPLKGESLIWVGWLHFYAGSLMLSQYSLSCSSLDAIDLTSVWCSLPQTVKVGH